MACDTQNPEDVLSPDLSPESSSNSRLLAKEEVVGEGPAESALAEPGLLEHRVSRRAFLSQLGAAGVAVSAQPLIAAAAPLAAPAAAPANDGQAAASGAIPITLNVNGQDHHLQIDARTTLLDCLRENLNLPGTKKGCDHGQCGACTVHVNGRRVNSCLSFAMMHGGDKITTIEGLGEPGKLHPMQAAFVEYDALQCGYCTSGQIMSAVALDTERCGHTDEDVRHAMYGNICRCGAYNNIVAAVQHARTQNGHPDRNTLSQRT